MLHLENMIPEKTFYAVSDNAHALAGCLSVLGTVALFGPANIWWAALAIMVFAAVKEGILDPITETPEVAGSGWRDFAGYTVGTSIGLIAWFIKVWVITR